MRVSFLATVTAAAALLALSASTARAAATITVDAVTDTNTSDAVVTLREAMLLAIGGTGGNGTTTGLGRALSAGEADNVSGVAGAASADTIVFATPAFPAPPATATILIGSQLPALTSGNDAIDANSPARGVLIQGNEARTFSCLVIRSARNAARGLRVTDCAAAVVLDDVNSDDNTLGPGLNVYDSTLGISLSSDGASGNLIVGNKIGTDAAGAAMHPDGAMSTEGVRISGPGNTVGGETAGDQNVISGNGAGVSISGPSATGNVVRGNAIGTSANGLVDIGNVSGLGIGNGASSNTIGGLLPGQRNILSGNAIGNVGITDADGNVVLGNFIGPDANGSAGTLNNGDGVSLSGGSSGNIVGPRNVISGNSTGIGIGGAGAAGNVIRGNFIGTNPAGTAAVANAAGIRIVLSAGPNTIGGTGPGEGNTIAYNTGIGLQVGSIGQAAPLGVAVRGNSIHSNTGLEIDNQNGGNTELVPPIVTSTAFGAVSGFACANCAVDVFSDASTDARFYEGSTIAPADGSFTFKNEAPFIEANVTATNTDAAGNTSELSLYLAIDSDADGTTDPSDADDDNDGMLDTADACRVFPEDYDGHEDADGCPDPDNDADGICDTGLTSPSCTGSDIGKTAFFGAGHNHTNPTNDCRNMPEDLDAFKDADGCPEPDNDNDGFPDTSDQCPGDENVAGPDGVLGSGEDQNHNGILNAGEDTVVADGVLTTDDVVLTYEDYDLVLNTDGCHDSPGDDRDGDGYRDEVEALHLGTKADDPCGTDAWPSDFVGTGLSANRFDTVDLASFVAPVRRINTNPNETGFNKRWDLVPGTTFGKHINIQDLTATITGASGFPPMFAGAKALNRTCVVAP